ncbi:MAG: designed protein CTPR3, partial [uncultured bacterium]
QKYDDAIFACKKVLEYNPANYEAEFMLANTYYVSGDFNQAIQAYTGMIQKNPQDHRLWHNIAEAHFSAGNTIEALKSFERVKKAMGANNPNTYLRIASCYEKLGNPRMAQAHLKELLSKNIPAPAKQTIEDTLSKLNQQYQLS